MVLSRVQDLKPSAIYASTEHQFDPGSIQLDRRKMWHHKAIKAYNNERYKFQYPKKMKNAIAKKLKNYAGKKQLKGSIKQRE